MYYLDTSALIKRYVKESGSLALGSIFKKSAVLFTSAITYAEIYATFNRLKREGLISSKEFNSCLNQFENDWAILSIIEFNEATRSLIPKTFSKLGLKGADLVHFVSALMLSENNIKFTFLTSDKKLLVATEEFGMTANDLYD